MCFGPPYASLLGLVVMVAWFFSFLKESHLIVDVSLTVVSQRTADLAAVADATNSRTEHLYPPRHKITLPINSLNSMFTNCDVVINNHTQLTADR